MPKHVTAKVISQKEIKNGCFRMKLEAPAIAKEAGPGQFLHIRCSTSADPLLRRPLSIHRIGAGHLEVLYNVVGKGTKLLSRKTPGDKIDLVGPLGNGFKISNNKKTVKMLVAGGMGVAPLLGLAEELSRQVKAKKGIIVILGAKTENHILCEKEFKKLGAAVHIATEDGSRGKKALATKLAEEVIKSQGCRWGNVTVYSAGPMAMVKALCGLMKGCSLDSQVSLEERMACGLGACLGCAVDTQAGYKRVCKDGPVFSMCDILYD